MDELVRIIKTKEKVATSTAIKAAGKNFVKIIKNNYPEFEDEGYIKFLLDADAQKEFCIQDCDLDLSKITKYGLRVKEKKLAAGIYGVDKPELEDMTIGEILEDSNLLVGDEVIENLTTSKKKSIFSIIFKSSLLDQTGKT